MAVLTASSPAERFALSARGAGCPRDQVENFLAAGIVLQPRQLAASAAARRCDHPDGPTEIGYGGARGGGKSHWGVAQLCADDAQRCPEFKGLILRKVGKAGRESFEDLRLRLLMGIPHTYSRMDGIIRFPNGSRVILGHFKSESDIDAYLGLEYDGILVEEATTLSSSKMQGIRSCCRTSKPHWRPRLYNTTNPGGIGHAWYKEKFVRAYRDGAESGTRFIPATCRDNRFLNPEYVANLETLTGWLRRAWLEGDWDIAAGQFFTTFRRDIHVMKEPIPIPPGWRVWLGFDYGFTHFTAAYLLAQSGDGIIYVVAEHGERRWLPERNAAAIHAMLARHDVKPERLTGVFAGADVFAKKQSGGTIADDYANNKAHKLAFSKANDDRINGAAAVLKRLGDVEAGIDPTLYLFPSCARLAECLPALEHDPHRPEDVMKVDCDDDGLGGDDWYDAMRYGVMAVANLREWNWS